LRCRDHPDAIARWLARGPIEQWLEALFGGHAPQQRTLAVQRNFLGTIFRTAQGVLPDTQA
jgi:hypothetical protein